jgi:hypothetical protein
MAFRTRFHLLAGLLICLTALMASPTRREPLSRGSSTALPNAGSALKPKTRLPRNFRPDARACGPTTYVTYMTDDGEHVSRVSYSTRSPRKDFEKELQKAGRILTIERTPDEFCRARALVERPKGGVTLLLQYGFRNESTGIVVMIYGPNREIVEEFEAVEEKPH